MAEHANTILAGLSNADIADLETHGEPWPLDLQVDLYLPGAATDWVYFPEQGLISVIVELSDGRGAEVGLVGVEGVVGLVEAIGTQTMASRCVVQGRGSALRVRAAHVRTLADQSPTFRQIAWSRLEFQMVESRQQTACRSHHTVEARLARWLLESRDRMDPPATVLELTQEFLAAMLGVQRTTVSTFASEFQASGLIRYARGRVELLDIEGLEAMACECRKVLSAERRRITAGGGGVEPPAAPDRRADLRTAIPTGGQTHP